MLFSLHWRTLLGMKKIIFLLAIAFAAPAQAAIVITTASGYSVTGITGLVVNGETYNVTLSRYHSFDSKFGPGDPPPNLPTFYFDPAGAMAARDAIIEALNTAPVVPVEAGPLPFLTRAIEVPYRYDTDPDNFYRSAQAYHDLDPTFPPPWYARNGFRSRDLGAHVFAEFVHLPEPASLAAWLGLLAAGAIAAHRRKQR